MKTMSFVSTNKLSVLFSEPKLQLYLQLNNSKKLKLWWNLMLCKKVWLFKNNNSKREKVDMCSTFEM
jgi:hypothetical protein